MAGTTNNPRVTIVMLPAPVVTTITGRRDLIVGALSDSATAVNGNLNQNIQAMTESEIRTLLGQDADLTYRVLEWISANEGYSQLDVIGVTQNPIGVKAIGSITFSGTATADGEYEVSVVDERKFKVIISVTSGNTATQIAASVDAALSALDNPPFSSSPSSGTVNLTAVDKGEVGNDYGIRVYGRAPGVSVSINDFSGGSLNPIVSSILDPIEGLRYTGLQWPESWDSDLSIAIDEFDSRFNASNAILDGVVFTGKTDTYANSLSFVSSKNSQSLVVGGNAKENDADSKGPAVLTPADWALSYFMGARAKRLTSGAPISEIIVTTSGPLDAIGGPELASLPYFNTPLQNVEPPSPKNLFSNTEQIALEQAGFTTYGVNDEGNSVITGQLVTTWTTDAAGNPNESFHYLNFVDTGSICREIIFNEFKAAFSHSRLTTGDLIAGRSMANAEKIKSFLLRIYKNLSTQALTQAGSDGESYFSQNTTVTIDLANRTVTISSKLPIVTQLGVIDYALQLSFTTSE